MNQVKELKNRMIFVEREISTLELRKHQQEQYQQYSDKIKELTNNIETLAKSVIEYQELEKKLSDIEVELNNLDYQVIPELKKAVEESNYQIILFEQYKKEYNQYSELFQRIEQVKEYVGVNGIQADIMDYTMNQILSMVNQLAAMMFGGRFTLNKFEITSDDFLISFLDKELNIIRPDISMMSSSQLGQLSMIISFVLLHNASQRFNIIRLDEVDNNLDNDNRLRFFDLVYTIMSILHFDQAIIISHNSELDLSNCDLIITRIQNIEGYRNLVNSGANIIADFTK